MVVTTCVRLTGAGCALLLTWLSAVGSVAAQQTDARATVQSELANLSASRAFDLKSTAKVREPVGGPWLWVAAGTTAAFAASYAFSEGFSYKAMQTRNAALARSEDVGLDLDIRLRARAQANDAQLRADLLNRVSDICLAGTVAATGAALLVWLTKKHKREDHRLTRTLLGPMVLRGAAGAGLVLREKF